MMVSPHSLLPQANKFTLKVWEWGSFYINFEPNYFYVNRNSPKFNFGCVHHYHAFGHRLNYWQLFAQKCQSASKGDIFAVATCYSPTSFWSHLHSRPQLLTLTFLSFLTKELIYYISSSSLSAIARYPFLPPSCCKEMNKINFSKIMAGANMARVNLDCIQEKLVNGKKTKKVINFLIVLSRATTGKHNFLKLSQGGNKSVAKFQQWRSFKRNQVH